MKKFLLNLFVAVILATSSCHPLVEITEKPDLTDTTTVITDTTLGNLSPGMYMKTFYYNAFQLDSMCVVDNLPRSLNDWTKNTLTDFETNIVIVRYAYIKEYNEIYEMLYIVTPNGDIYVVQKREAIKEEK